MIAKYALQAVFTELVFPSTPTEGGASPVDPGREDKPSRSTTVVPSGSGPISSGKVKTGSA